MCRILILTRNTAYGKYLRNLADQLGPDIDSRLGNPSFSGRERWRPDLVVMDQEGSVEAVKEKFGLNGKVPFIVLSEDEREEKEHGNCRVLPKPLPAGYFVQTLFEFLGGEQFAEHFAVRDFSQVETFAMGVSPAMQGTRASISRISDTTLPVLIQGETGTGKGVVARTLHNFSSRNSGRYMEINCANIPRNLMESELFGHRQGAFTGAWKNKTGRFQMASGGTVFLDEISEMSPLMQAKLLQVLQDGEFSPVGGTDSVTVDIRILAATNADLKNMMAESLFRKDLYYRLAVISLYLPPLRERMEDIEILSTYFLEKYCRAYNKKNVRISLQLQDMLHGHHWPGNVRELENMIRTLVALENEEQILEDLQNRRGGGRHCRIPDYTCLKEGNPGLGLKEITGQAVEEAEKEIIAKALDSSGGNRKRAAEVLRVSYKSLLNKIKNYGL